MPLSEQDDYDERTCLTAGQLRQLGAVIDEKVPDCAWLPRSCIKFEVGEVKLDANDPTSLRGSIKLQFSEPFRWVRFTYTYTEDDDGKDS